ncbi:MAG: ABC transporter permease, partial [Clostridium sp.]|nr:ABC transporter permease [Clostridium sp.]
MKNLIKAEFFKLLKSFGYRMAMALSVGVGLFFAFFWIANSVKASGYQMLPIMDSFVLFHTIFTSVFTAMFLCSEFSDRTMGMGLFCGLPRRSVFLAKIVVFFIGLLCLLSTVVTVPMVVMTLVNGFGMELTMAGCMEVLAQVIFFWLICMAMGGFFVFLALATKNAVATIGIGLGISYLLLVLTSNYVNADMMIFSPVKYSFICQMFILSDWEELQKGLFVGVSLVTL